MAGKLAYERFHWFHGQIKAGLYPNARQLAERFEISPKQAQRDIEFIRDRIGAPLRYDALKKGYCYEKDGYELPPVWFKEEELIALSMALRLAAALPDRAFKNSLYNLLERFASFRYLGSSPVLDVIREKVSVKNIEYARVEEAVFHQVVDALFRNRAIKLSYHSPFKHETTERVIQPLHLLCYMGTWHLIAFCSLKRGIRDFVLSRVRAMEVMAEAIPLPRGLPSVREYLRRNFGVIAGAKSTEVCLKFSPEVADWIAEQVWHKGQELSRNEDGTICLRFPVADFLEVRREILRFGSSVEVLSPADLREEIKKEIRKMARLYR